MYLPMAPPDRPRLFHIVHVDRLRSIVADGFLWSDAEVRRRQPAGTTIGIDEIKRRRLDKGLVAHDGLHVGDCVPFYFCPRSVMLYVIHMASQPQLAYRGGQGPVVHLVADLHETVTWADQHFHRWAFTDGNAAAGYTQDYADLEELHRVNWDSVRARNWSDPIVKESKQAEFLLEDSFPWSLVRGIGVRSQRVLERAAEAFQGADHEPPVAITPNWYY